MKERVKIRETINEPKNFAKAAAGLVAAAAGTAAIIGAVSGLKKAKEDSAEIADTVEDSEIEE